MLDMDDYLQSFNTKEQQVVVEPMEDLIKISLDNNILGRITRISTQANPLVCKELAFFLKNIQDLFT